MDASPVLESVREGFSIALPSFLTFLHPEQGINFLLNLNICTLDREAVSRVGMSICETTVQYYAWRFFPSPSLRLDKGGG